MTNFEERYTSDNSSNQPNTSTNLDLGAHDPGEHYPGNLVWHSENITPASELHDSILRFGRKFYGSDRLK